MLSKTVEVRNSTGLHARPAACLVKAAKKFSCKVTLSPPYFVTASVKLNN